MTIKFETGKSYATRSACDHDCVFAFEIIARTEKSVTIKRHGEQVRRGIKIWNDVETFKPFGTYSMCAIISADKQDWRS